MILMGLSQQLTLQISLHFSLLCLLFKHSWVLCTVKVTIISMLILCFKTNGGTDNGAFFRKNDNNDTGYRFSILSERKDFRVFGNA